MESNSMRYQEEQRSSLTSQPSPKTQTNGNHHQHTQPPSPRPITRSEPGNPYPTTFVQADTTSFKQVVQMLTGSSETISKQQPCSKQNNNNNNIPPKKQGFKLYERRNSLHKNLNINPLIPIFSSNNNNSTNFSPRTNQEILSPSILDFPSLVLSPVTPLIPDPFNRSGARSASLNAEAEDKAIKEKGFFLHPSPRALTPRDATAAAEPRLLPLFPTTSPRASGPSQYSAS